MKLGDRALAARLGGHARTLRDAQLGGAWDGDSAQLLVCGLFAARLLALEAPELAFDRARVLQLLCMSTSVLERVVAEALAAAAPGVLAATVDDVIALLAAASPDDATPGETLLGFYEPFLAAHDAVERRARGVYYTPGELADYLVAGIDARLCQQPGTEAGLAADARAGEAPRFVLDPAVGGGVFLRAVIRRVHQRLRVRWTARGVSESGQQSAWQRHVSEQLLPRLAGLDVQPVACALAALQVRLTLAETGYRADGREVIAIHCGDALQLLEELERGGAPSAAQAVLAGADVIVGNPPYARGGGRRGAFWDALLEPYKKPLRAERNLQPLADDYVRFLRLVEYLLARKPLGAAGLVTSSTFLDGHLHSGMRACLARSFQRIDVLDLGGSSKRAARGQTARRDENVFGVGQGIAALFLVHDTQQPGRAPGYASLRGARADKLRALQQPGAITFACVAPDDPTHAFLPRPRPPDEYLRLRALDSLFEVSSIGGKPGDDAHLVAFERDALLPQLEAFRSRLRARPELARTEAARRMLAFDDAFSPALVAPYAYRPFDTRYVYDDARLWTRPVRRLRERVDGQPMLLATRFARDGAFAHVFATCLLPDVIFLSNKSSVNCFAFPRSALAPGVGVDRDLAFAYLYALLHANEYRARYAAALAEGFPRVAFPREPALLAALAEVGEQLLQLHLHGLASKPSATDARQRSQGSRAPRPSASSIARPGPSASGVPGELCIELDAQHRIESVPSAIWEQRIGGYQVCHKWLLDRARAGRELSPAELDHYAGLVRTLAEMQRLVAAIDARVAQAGGLLRVLGV